MSYYLCKKTQQKPKAQYLELFSLDSSALCIYLHSFSHNYTQMKPKCKYYFPQKIVNLDDFFVTFSLLLRKNRIPLKAVYV